MQPTDHRFNGRRPFLDLVSYARAGPGHRAQFSSAQLAQISRTTRGVPEVMVKVSGGGKTATAVAAHFAYIGREEFQIETDDGERIKDTEQTQSLLDDWELELDAAETRQTYRSTPGPSRSRLVHNIVLSMPADSSADSLLRASRHFAHEQFASKHRYALVLHTDQPHPHVHMVVKAMGEQGRKLNIRKSTLREWRRAFAHQLRAQGIEANATDRVVRGITRSRQPDGIYHAMRDGRSTRILERVQAVAAALRNGPQLNEPGKERLLQTRRAIAVQWNELQGQLQASGHGDLAQAVGRFVHQMPPPRTEREWITRGLMQAAQANRQQDRAALTR